MNWLIPHFWDRLNLQARLALIVALFTLLTAIGTAYQASRRIVRKTQLGLTVEYNRQMDILESVAMSAAFADGKDRADFSVERIKSVFANYRYGEDVSQISFQDTSEVSVFSRAFEVELTAPLFFSRWCGLEIIDLNRPIIADGVYYGLLSLSMSPNNSINQAWADYLYLVRVTLASFALVLFSIWIVLRTSLNPLLTLAEASRAMTGGNLSVRVAVTGSPELRAVLLAFNKMAAGFQETLASLRESESRLRQLSEWLPQLVWTTKPDGHCDYLNRRWLEYTGVPEAGQLGYGWLERLHPDDRAPAVAAWEAAVASGADFKTEYRIRRHDGEYRWFDTRAVRLRNAQGQAVKWFGSNTDITERKREEAAKDALVAALEEKEQEIVKFLYAATHDLRAPLVNIQGYSEYLEKYIKDLRETPALAAAPPEAKAKVSRLLAERIPEALGYITGGVRKMNRLINALIKVARVGRLEFDAKPLDMDALLKSVLSTFAFDLERNGAAVKVGALPGCKGDSGAINQVFVNLIGNAIKYRDGGRKLEIAVSGKLKDANTALYSVRSNGQEISASDLEKIWDLFYRVPSGSPAGEAGEGIGLTIAKRIVTLSGGRIWAESKEGEGAEFFIELPV
ncbi:MAG: PAS domain-containing protein [Elusimicrobia bacterium]|nr:PAS domain-containing protein [Elusimicrobiota bacterium]